MIEIKKLLIVCGINAGMAIFLFTYLGEGMLNSHIIFTYLYMGLLLLFTSTAILMLFGALAVFIGTIFKTLLHKQQNQ